MKNYYQILNVRPAATDEEIKRSYRVLAKKFHPDVNPGDVNAANRFADINEAYEVLSDAQKRAEYNNKLKEAQAPKPKPEDIIAQQREAAQAAARQAAARQAAIRNSFKGSDPATILMAQRMAQAAAQAAQAQAAAQAQVAAQANQVKAQMQSVKTEAFREGKEKGAAEARAEAAKREAALNETVKRLTKENTGLYDQIAEVERDRSELEQELFNRDRELTQEQAKSKHLEEQIEAMRQAASAGRGTGAESASLNGMIDKLQARINQLEMDKTQANLRNQAQIKLQQDKRKEMQDKIDELNRRIAEMTDELETLRAENEQWQQYAKSEDFLSDAEAKMQAWEKKQRADKKLAKNTLYGTLGVLIWATDEEIAEAYNKLVRRYKGKSDADSADKLAKIEEAYATLSDQEKRWDYNASIDIDDARIAEERAAIAENEQMQEEYRSKLESKEFWERFDEIMFNAQTGDAECQNQLGEMYYYGDEIEQDLESAVYWFKEAAKQKHADAMYNLGVCFVNGEGTEKNKATGLGFIRQAAKMGSELAKNYKE